MAAILVDLWVECLWNISFVRILVRDRVANGSVRVVALSQPTPCDVAISLLLLFLSLVPPPGLFA